MGGWEPAEVTTHYDADGNVTGYAVTVREPEWSTDDVAAVLAARRRANVKRSPTGYTMAEATDPENRGKFTVDIPTTDFALQKLQLEQERYETKYPSAKGDRSLVWTVGLKP